MREKKTAAVILKTTDVFDADRSFLMFTRELGKIRARAKGVRRTTSRLTGHLLAYLPTELELVETGGWYLITKAHIQETGSYPADSLSFLQYTELVAEAVDVLMVEGEPHPDLYEGLVYTLERLHVSPHPQLVVAEFILKCLVDLGYRPELEISVSDGSKLDPEQLVWDSELGGVLNRDQLGGLAAFQVSIKDPKVVVALRQLVRPQFLAERIAMEEDVRREVVAITLNYLQTRMGKPLRSAVTLGL
jgi:DNA repair protein RecO (recombination protein O)